MKLTDKQTKEAEKATKDFLENTGTNEIWHIDENGKLTKPKKDV